MEEIELTTTNQVERSYRVKAENEEQARKRLRAHFADPDSLREGIVTLLPEREKNTTPPQIKSAEEVAADVAAAAQGNGSSNESPEPTTTTAASRRPRAGASA